ncbi:MAG: hypothetical protein NT088_04535 [Candidatus Omnitrophica bacterium]|nr:hypothetical protein [Candidatus Omnitrophota bacterium]
MRNCKTVLAVGVFITGLFLCVFMLKAFAQDYAQQNSARLQMPPDNEQADVNADTQNQTGDSNAQVSDNSITDNSANNGQAGDDEVKPAQQSSGGGGGGGGGGY